jgi:hypothetical protein
MVEVGARQDDAGDGRIAQGAWMQSFCIFYLKTKVGRGSSEEPRGSVGANGDLRLGPWLKARTGLRILAGIFSHGNAVSASAIPLRETAPGRRTEDPNVHLAGVRVLRSRTS